MVLDGNEISVRPKSFAVLVYLVENSGRLVSRDEIFAAVWPNVAVTDDALVQSISELRQALGDDARRLIRTIPRRGYRFEPHVSDVPAADPSGTVSELRARNDPETGINYNTTRFLDTVLMRWRLRSLAALAMIIFAIVGARWIAASAEWSFFGALPWNGQFTKNPGVAKKSAIAVLPFVNQSNQPGQDYFADGLTQDIINALGRFSALTVMSWNAVSPYREKATNPAEIARNLGVRYQVEGSIQKTEGRVRVIAQLVDSGGHVLWSARFDEALADVFALQDSITTQIARALPVRVTQIEQQRVSAKPTKSLEAYDYVLRARSIFQHPGRANNVEARALLKRAIELDPYYAAAYAALAETYYAEVSMGWAEFPPTIMSRAEELAKKALSLNSSEVRAHIILGRVYIFDRRYDLAEAEIDRAIAVNPNDAQALAGRGNIFMWLGRTDAAIDALEQAQGIDPALNPLDRFALGLAYYLKQRYTSAIEQAELNLRETPGANFSRVVLAAAYAQLNQLDDAARVAMAIRRLDPTFNPQEFGTKFLNPADLERLRNGLHKAGL